MESFLLPLPKPNLTPEGREAVRIARQYAQTGKYEPIIDTSHIPEQPPAGPLPPESPGDPEPQPEPWKPTPEEMERLRRTQAIFKRVIEDRIRQAEADHPDSLTEPDVHIDQSCDFGDYGDFEKYFATASLVSGPIRINAWTVINDPKKAINYHLAGLKASPPGSVAARADQIHLRQLKAALEAGKSVLKPDYAIHT